MTIDDMERIEIRYSKWIEVLYDETKDTPEQVIKNLRTCYELEEVYDYGYNLLDPYNGNIIEEKKSLWRESTGELEDLL